jgi:hypothetical protein
LKDFVFNKLIDNEEANGFLMAMVRIHQCSIIRDIDSNPSHYDSLQQTINNCIGDEKKNLSSFLKEFFSLAKLVISPDHFNFYQYSHSI